MTALPEPQKATRRDLILFDMRHGLPTALRVLRAHLTLGELARVLLAFAREARRDPLAAVHPAEAWDPELDVLVRHQLRSAVLFDMATKEALDWVEPDRVLLLREVIAEVGSAFIGAIIPFPSREDWALASGDARASFVNALRGRMINADMTPAGITDNRVGFDVHACRFAQLCREIGRPHLVPMFCEADSRFFAEEGPAGGLIRLRRTKTIGRGQDRCDFRFQLR